MQRRREREHSYNRTTILLTVTQATHRRNNLPRNSTAKSITREDCCLIEKNMICKNRIQREVTSHYQNAQTGLLIDYTRYGITKKYNDLAFTKVFSHVL